jgi:hypothetical protein
MAQKRAAVYLWMTPAFAVVARHQQSPLPWALNTKAYKHTTRPSDYQRDSLPFASLARQANRVRKNVGFGP